MTCKDMSAKTHYLPVPPPPPPPPPWKISAPQVKTLVYTLDQAVGNRFTNAYGPHLVQYIQSTGR